MQQRDKNTDHGRQSATAPAAVSVSADPTRRSGARRRPKLLSPSQLLDGTEICSRFEQVSGKKRSSSSTSTRLKDPESR